MEILYPEPSKTSDIREWDIQLLCFILIEYFKQELNTPEQLAVRKIREMRNDFYAHYAKACIDRNTYFSLWSELSLIMTTMAAKMPESEKEKNDNLIRKLCSSKLDMNSATEEIKKLNDSDEFIDKIKQCLNSKYNTKQTHQHKNAIYIKTLISYSVISIF
jgi:glycyl-tRNA synthetase (class II)